MYKIKQIVSEIKQSTEIEMLVDFLQCLSGSCSCDQDGRGQQHLCWCSFGIGHPAFADHTTLCKQIQEYFKSREERKS